MTAQYYFQVLATLALVCGGLLLMYRLSLKYKTRVFKGDLKIVDRLYVEKGVSLAVVAYKNRELILGVSPKELTLIKEIPLSSDSEKNILTQ